MHLKLFLSVSPQYNEITCIALVIKRYLSNFYKILKSLTNLCSYYAFYKNWLINFALLYADKQTDQRTVGQTDGQKD